MHNGTIRKVLLSCAAVAVVSSLVAAGTYATWTDTDSAAQAVSSGTVDVALGASGGSAGDANNRLTVGFSGAAPGDTAQRHFQLRNAGTINFASFSMYAASANSTAMYSALTVKIEKCSVAWVESATTPYTYTCGAAESGTRTTVLADAAMSSMTSSSQATLSNVTLTSGASNSLMMTITFPSSYSNNAGQNNSDTITYTFTGTQRSGTAK